MTRGELEGFCVALGAGHIPSFVACLICDVPVTNLAICTGPIATGVLGLWLSRRARRIRLPRAIARIVRIDHNEMRS